MPTWNAGQYLKFVEERTRPCRDLVAAIRPKQVRRIIDLGCGPGNSTMVLADRWPDAEVTGLDNAASMIDTARHEYPRQRWVVREIADWAANADEQFDLVFSNAALHWVDDHTWLYPRLVQHLLPGGALAVQIPADFDALPHQFMRELAPAEVKVKEWHSHDPGFYYDVLSGHAATVDIWETVYQHVLPNADAIVEWYKGTGLRPFLEAISDESRREQFLSDFHQRVRQAYTPHADAKVLFPFRRLFVIAYR